MVLKEAVHTVVPYRLQHYNIRMSWTVGRNCDIITGKCCCSGATVSSVPLNVT